MTTVRRPHLRVIAPLAVVTAFLSGCVDDAEGTHRETRTPAPVRANGAHARTQQTTAPAPPTAVDIGTTIREGTGCDINHCLCPPQTQFAVVPPDPPRESVNLVREWSRQTGAPLPVARREVAAFHRSLVDLLRSQVGATRGEERGRAQLRRNMFQDRYARAWLGDKSLSGLDVGLVRTAMPPRDGMSAESYVNHCLWFFEAASWDARRCDAVASVVYGRRVGPGYRRPDYGRGLASQLRRFGVRPARARRIGRTLHRTIPRVHATRDVREGGGALQPPSCPGNGAGLAARARLWEAGAAPDLVRCIFSDEYLDVDDARSVFEISAADVRLLARWAASG